ncbi:SNF1-related protein kinase regulatory subunit beta-2 [Heracleum sosnowskyi]|uniref:SNF1-related protein kinase regulatory subunit beta-2 n=1 Tax=Heracleum sosnowskyi TaxID=360622 RepID=A0AAD8GSZ0_9APIA|nr:SNF1-related protein kinase regulatory subunit beta-2 [Heracleum sosnowskyi]
MSNDSMLRRYESGSLGVPSDDEDEFSKRYLEYVHNVSGSEPESTVQSSLCRRLESPYLKPLKFTPLYFTYIMNTKLKETTISTMITWQYEGREVAIEGSWDGWKEREYLQRSNGDMAIMKVLPVGIYLYLFIVDGQKMCAPNLPRERDDEGNLCNILDLERHVLENEGNILESESSPLSSYNNEHFSFKDFKQTVPEFPPFLEITPLNNPESSDDHQSQEKPLPCVLNHLFLRELQPGSIELSSTQRFSKNYVTLYKSICNPEFYS